MKKFNRLSNTPSSVSGGEDNAKGRTLELEKETFQGQLRSLEKALEDFKIEKARLVEDQKYKLEGKSNSQLEEHRTAKDGLKQVHKARIEKVFFCSTFC